MTASERAAVIMALLFVIFIFMIIWASKLHHDLVSINHAIQDQTTQIQQEK